MDIVPPAGKGETAAGVKAAPKVAAPAAGLDSLTNRVQAALNTLKARKTPGADPPVAAPAPSR